MCKWDENTSMGGEQVVLDLPAFVRPDKEKRTVSIDKCIVPVIEGLWDAGVYTLGCCCGHGKENPSVVLSTVCHIQPAMAVIRRLDKNRIWTLKQWQLVDVATV